MTDYYVDPTATGADTGATWANAWTTLQRAIDGTDGTKPGAGDTVYCKANGTTADETLSAAIDMDGTSGNSTSGYVRFIGVNSSGVNDGTRYLINANSKSVGIYCLGNYKWLENFEIYGSGGAGIDWTNQYFDFWIMKNVVSRDNTGVGFDLYYSGYAPCWFIECRAYNNDGDGFSNPYRGTIDFIHCVSHSNGGKGFQGPFAEPPFTHWIGCLAYENTGDNYSRARGTIYQSVSDGSTSGDGVEIINSPTVIIGSRITNNNTYGISIGDLCVKQFCYLGGNGTDENGSLGYNLLHKGASTVTTEGTDTDHGYNDPTNDDYSLTSDATYRRAAIDLVQ